MFHRGLVIFAAAALAIGLPNGKSAHAQPGLTIEGSADCGDWINARARNQSVTLEHYLLGLLNGMVMGSSIEFWRAGGTKVSREQVYLWMDNYCRSSPLSSPLDGAVSLINERTGRALDRHWGRQ
jgi:hypothetical protein